MKFSTLAQYFDKLEATSSRLALIDILSDLFKQCDHTIIYKVIYLTQGRVAPFYAPIEIGMADKTVASALAAAFGIEREKVLDLYAKLGDMGLVAQDLNQELGIRNHGQRVEDVFAILLTIAHTSGVGTVEKKTTLLKDLLTQVDPISAKHLVRIPLGKTRLGIGDPTILDALALG